MKKSYNGIVFKFWFYRVSLGQLLIRCPKSNDNPRNIDIMFFDVSYVELPRILPNLVIEDVKNEDIEYIRNKISKPLKAENITVLSSNGHRYFVVSSIMKVEENELDIFELPFQL